MLIKIGELARRAGLTVRTLHHYHDIGLLAPSVRSDSGYRLYTRDDVVRLYRIQALQRLGLSLTEIGTLLAGEGAALGDIVDQQLDAIDRQIAQAQALRERLTYLRARLDAGADSKVADWLAVLELMSLSEKYFRADELARLRQGLQATATQWPPMIAAVREAQAAGTPPHDPAVQALALRWLDLVQTMLDADVGLVAKWTRMHLREAALTAQGAVERPLLDYLARAVSFAKVELYREHLTPDEAARLRPDAPRQVEWGLLVSDIRHHAELGTPPGSADGQALFRHWRALQNELTGNDTRLRDKLATIMRSNPALARRFGMDDNTWRFVDAAAAAAQPETDA